MNLKAITLQLLSSTLMISMSYGQYFSEVGLSLGVNVSTTYNNWGCGVSFYDFNKDGWPDLSFSRFNQAPVFYINNQGTFELIDLGIPNTNEAKMIVWVDYDNDGDADLFLTRYMAPWSLYQNDGNLTLTDVTAAVGITQVPTSMAFGASWGDINNDGWLDLYISNYNTNVNQPGTTITNYLFRSDGDGTFTEVAGQLGVTNGSKHSFLTTFVDINRDGWQDLYVANDRLPDSNDLYLNLGNGQFQDITTGSGAGVYLNTMSNTVGDFDNDGDMDFYIANSEQGNNLLRNNGNNTFTNVAPAVGVAVNHFCWGSVWMDYNLDGWQDLYVNTGYLSNQPSQNYFYTSNGNGTFTYAFLSGFQGHLNVAHSCASGDYDNDGNPDLVVGVRAPLKCEVWHNNSTTTNNHLKVSLEGTISNRDGIGSFIDCYAGGILQTRYAMCGEGYMSQDSQYEIFGLNDWETVDSLKITWLSGIVDVFYDISPNQYLHIIEGSSFSASLNYSGTISICETDSITLTTGDFVSYLWSTGEITPSLTVQTPGVYSLTVIHENGLTLTTQEVTVVVESIPPLLPEYPAIVCLGSTSGYLDSYLNQAPELSWTVNGVEASLPVQDLGPGLYTITAVSEFCSKTEFIEILSTLPIEAEWTLTNPGCFDSTDGSIELQEISGLIGSYTFDPGLTELMNIGAGNYQALVTDSLGCSASFSFEIIAPAELQAIITSEEADVNNENGSLIIEVSGGTPDYSITWSNGFSGSSISNLSQGFYQATVTDANGCTSTFDSQVGIGIQEVWDNCAPIVSQSTINLPCNDVILLEVYNAVGQRLYTQVNPKEKVNFEFGQTNFVVVRLTFQSGRFFSWKLVR